jgi:hypothetical protein
MKKERLNKIKNLAFAIREIERMRLQHEIMLMHIKREDMPGFPKIRIKTFEETQRKVTEFLTYE